MMDRPKMFSEKNTFGRHSRDGKAASKALEASAFFLTHSEIREALHIKLLIASFQQVVSSSSSWQFCQMMLMMSKGIITIRIRNYQHRVFSQNKKNKEVNVT